MIPLTTNHKHTTGGAKPSDALTCMLKSYSAVVGSSLRSANTSGATGTRGAASVVPTVSTGRRPAASDAAAPTGSTYTCSYISTTAEAEALTLGAQ